MAALAMRSPMVATNHVQEPQGLAQLSESKKLILDDTTRVMKVLDRGESFRQRTASPKRNDRRQADPEDDDELLVDIGVELDKAKVESALDPEKKFMPLPNFAKIMTFDRVHRIVDKLACFKKEKNKGAIAKEIFYGRSDGSISPAVKLLAVLIGIEQTQDLAKHLNDGLRDSCLTLQKKLFDEQHYLHCRQHGGHSTLNHYRRPRVREDFARWSYTLSAPFVKWEQQRHSHYVLDTWDIIPIIHNVQAEDGASEEKGNSSGDGNAYGGFSKVYKSENTPRALGLWRPRNDQMRHPQHFFALKKLTSSSRHKFNLELSSLLFTGQQYTRKHLIQLLTSFEVVNPAPDGMSTYYLLFDWAEGSLEKFWQNNENLVGDKSHCRWMAVQFFGISDALQCVHNDRAPTIRYLEDRDSNEELYGRHGDIKPGNFLWFRNRDSSPGLLALSDFGLGRLHTQVSKSKQDPKNIERSASYRCPEFDLPLGQVSQRSDIFRLGCVFLEYVTRFLLGFDAVKSVFPERRLENDVYGFNSDTFFSVRNQQAYLKPAVKDWIEILQDHSDCSWYPLELLEAIKDGMLNPNPEKRMRANQHSKRMKELLKACDGDEEYYLGTRN